MSSPTVRPAIPSTVRRSSSCVSLDDGQGEVLAEIVDEYLVASDGVLHRAASGCSVRVTRDSPRAHGPHPQGGQCECRVPAGLADVCAGLEMQGPRTTSSMTPQPSWSEFDAELDRVRAALGAR